MILLSQSLTRAVLLGLAKHQALGVITVLQAIVTILVAIVAATYWQTLGLCYALAGVCSVTGLVQLWNGCQILRVSLSSYLRSAVLPALAACALPVGVGFLMRLDQAELQPLAFVAHLAAYLLLFSLPGYFICLRSVGSPVGVPLRNAEHQSDAEGSRQAPLLDSVP